MGDSADIFMGCLRASLAFLAVAIATLIWRVAVFLGSGEWIYSGCALIDDMIKRGLPLPVCTRQPETGYLGVDKILAWGMYSSDPAFILFLMALIVFFSGLLLAQFGK